MCLSASACLVAGCLCPYGHLVCATRCARAAAPGTELVRRPALLAGRCSRCLLLCISSMNAGRSRARHSAPVLAAGGAGRGACSPLALLHPACLLPNDIRPRHQCALLPVMPQLSAPGADGGQAHWQLLPRRPPGAVLRCCCGGGRADPGPSVSAPAWWNAWLLLRLLLLLAVLLACIHICNAGSSCASWPL